MADIRIDIIADYVCPWCYLGYTRLKQAIDQLGEDYRFQIKWQPFELHPDIPKEGVERELYLTQKFGSQERLNEASHALQQIGKEEGLEYNFSEKDRIPNTILAHQLATKANKLNLGTQTALSLFQAYFTHGKDIGNKEVLREIARDVGMNEADIETLFDETDTNITSQKLKKLRSLGIQSVPTYVINDKYMIQGAHTPNDFCNVLNNILKESSV